MNQLANDLFEDEEPATPYHLLPKEPKESHDLATTLMRKTYRDTNKVLVLDACLERTEWKYHPL